MDIDKAMGLSTFALIMGIVKIQRFHLLGGILFFTAGIIDDQKSEGSLISSFGSLTMDSFQKEL
jgi:hypothetical protein